MADPTDLTAYPVPSNSFIPGARNAQDFDNLLNGGNITVTNRSGAPLDSYEKSIADARLAYGGLTNRGLWVTATAYAVNDLWQSNIDSTWYLVLTAYTADTTEALDIASGNVQVQQGVTPNSLANYATLAFNVIADIDTGTTINGTVTPKIGDLVSVEDYAVGNNSSQLKGKIVAGGTGTHDGGKYIDLPILGLQFEQDMGLIINAKSYGLKGNFTDDDLPQLIKLWAWAPWGSTILYPEGHYKLDGGTIHPLKQLFHEGVGRSPSFLPTANNIKGTSFYFPTFSGVNKGGIYMPPPSGADFSRFSSFTDIMLFGNGTNDNNGTVTCLKINNLGTHLTRVDSRYGSVGIENNYSVGARWEDLKLFGAAYGAFHVYDAATPFGAETNSVATENAFTNIQVATSSINTFAIGWYQDATCAYANNHHGGSFDAESCYTGLVLEGRIASKDHDAITVFGSASFQSVGNVFDSAWFEANVANNLELRFDPAEAEPAVTFRNLFQDVAKTLTSADTQNMLTTPAGDRPLILGTTKDAAQGLSGGWGSPFTAGQYLIHGKELNTPLLRNLITEKVPKFLGNRATINDKSTYEWSYAKDAVPVVASGVNIANLQLFTNTNRSVAIEYTIAATGSAGTHYFIRGVIVVNNDSDVITFSTLVENFLPAGTRPMTLQPIRVSVNTFGLFFYKDGAIGEIVHATVDLKYVVGAGNTSDRQSILTTFSV